MASAAGIVGKFAVIGESVATSNFLRIPNAIVLKVAEWSPTINQLYIRQIIARQIPVFLASPLSKIVNERGEFRVFGTEVQQLLAAGYRQWGNWLLPPGR